MTKLFNRSEQKPVRKRLRAESTKAERLLWKYLRNRQVGGFKFRRQYGIGHYILDFYCPEKRLGIELDGSAHGSDERKEYDSNRQGFIEACGIKILRFNNDQVLNGVDNVLVWILETCGKSIDRPSIPSLPKEMTKGRS